MNAAKVRAEIELGPIRPPQRLAPYSYALGAEVRRPESDVVPESSDGDAFGRLILLHDPEGAEAWDGTMRLVAYLQADLDPHEMRASWTATTPALGLHVQAFCEVLEHAAGLPPVGVTDLSSRSRA